MTTLWQDLRFAARMLLRSPGFAVMVVVILAVGIGATTAMLSVADAVMFQSCPYKDPETLVYVYENSRMDRKTGAIVRNTDNRTSLPTLRDWRARNHVFESLGGVVQWLDSTVQSAGKKERAGPQYVSPGFFSALGVRPILGRTFAPEEEKPGGERVAILSYTHWQHWFAGDPNVIGKTLLVDKQVCTVVGVLPADFRWLFYSRPIAPGLWMPAALLLPEGMDRRDTGGVIAVGRLRAGVDLSQAQAEMNLIATQLAQEYPETMGAAGVSVVPLSEKVGSYVLRAGKPRVLLMMMGVAASVLLIACLHVASLLIARSAERGREMVVRAALGAHRLRLIRQSLTESVLLAGLGGLSGAILTYWALRVLSAVRGRSIPLQPGPGARNRLIPWFLDIQMDARSLLYVIAISLLTCVAFGLLPALGVSKIRLNEALSEGRAQTQTPRFRRLRAGLVVLDIAIAFVLLAGAGLMANSFTRVLRIDLQVNTRNVLVASVNLEDMEDRYSRPQQRIAFSRQIVEGIGRLPGVQSVAVADGTPASRGSGSTPTFTIEGLPPIADRMDIRFTPVSADYFRLLRIPVLNGRYFTEYDNEVSPPVAIISESLAKRLWPNQDPLGRHLTHGKSNGVTREIVGVVRDIKHLGGYPDDEVYAPHLQVGGLSYPDVMVRTDGRTAGLPAAIPREILSVEPEARVSNVCSLEQQVLDVFSPQQMNTLLLLSGFAGVAVLLAGIGIYGSIAYTVSRRTHEIGIRMALGARSSDVLNMVLRQGLTFTVTGLALGLGGALAATRMIRSRLYGVSPTDPLTFVCVALLLTGVALLACYLPARRAARIDPMEALRYE